MLADRAGDDQKFDFLTNDVPDANHAPDTLWLSNGSTAVVNTATGAATDGPVTNSDRVVQLTANMTSGWSFVELPDPGAGFQDTLAEHAAVNHSSGVVAFAYNPYAAMPSLHSADALIVGVTMALVVRRPWAKALWLAWPAWVWFSVMATGNHFWLDIAAGVLVAGAAALLVTRWRRAA